eukprot:11337235-Karenia_brevis.AAC.1
MELPSHVTDLLELVMLQLRTPLTSDQHSSLQQGTLQVPTHKYRGLGVVHAVGPLSDLMTALALHLSLILDTARHPQLGSVS